jgi:cytochrome c2
MGEISENDPKAGKTAELPEADPLLSSSMSGSILIATLLLMVTVGWSLWDEVYGQRPWKGYQERFVERYAQYLSGVKSRQVASADQEIRQSPEYQRLVAEAQAEEERIKPRRDEIDRETSLLSTQIAAVSTAYQEVRGRIGVQIYEAEIASSESAKQSRLKRVEELRNQVREFDFPLDAQGKTEERRMEYPEIEALYNELKDRRAKLLTERITLTQVASELAQKRDAYLQERLPDLSPAQINGLRSKLDTFDYSIRQINLQGGEMVDRCESCHLGIREPITITRAAMSADGKEDLYARAFTSHPNRELLKIHDADRFGCSTCHNGNGRATTSIEKAHGNYKHWLWPLYKRENVEAGCQQCHTKDMVLDHASTLNQGKDLFQQKGCYACHRYEGYDRDAEGLFNVRQTIKQLEAEKADNLRQSQLAKTEGDQAADNEVARRLYARAQNLIVSNSQLDARIEQLDNKAKYLMWDRKTFGPNLKEIRYKLRKEWLPVWLKDPHAWRPGTKMPRFRLDDDEIQAISAYLWQAALQGLPALPAQQPGNAARGKTLFETRGCLACHSIGEGNQRLGSDFAANLTRVGDKASYEYIVRWIHDPRQRLAPYSPSEKKDLLPEDYQKKGLPFIFDRDRSRSPNTGRELQWQNNSVMPNFRLSDQDTRDIATYLFSLRRNEQFPSAAFMDDPKLRDRGASLIRAYGCASCHEIRGFEDEQRIGTELTQQGSKPIERLDFALLTHEAKNGIDPFNGQKGEKWYNHKGFFEKKLNDPAIFDKGKIKDKQERLRMPKIAFGPNDERKTEEINALTTFLLGSVDSAVPASLRYSPADQRQAVQEGWWVIKKYNCMGCHNIQVGQRSTLDDLPLYQDPDWKEQLPPRLTSEGARVNPDWLLRFLNDPSLSGADGTTNLDQNGKGNRNGVRLYLEARMPTFNFSPNELRLLVNFFMAASAQSQPYIAEKLDPLTEQERTMARALFTSQAAPCLKCHITDNNNVKDKNAPNFLIAAERLKPGWTFRWLLDPAQISPGTAMPSGLFRREGDRWVFSGPTPDSFKTYTKDHADLLVRYMFQFTPEEQRRLGGGGTSANTARGPTAVKDKHAARQRAPSAPAAALARRLVVAAH